MGYDVAVHINPQLLKIPPVAYPPPHCLRFFRAFLISSAEPNNKEPTGAPKPLDKQTDIESANAPQDFGSSPVSVNALKIRAPSICNFK